MYLFYIILILLAILLIVCFTYQDYSSKIFLDVFLPLWILCFLQIHDLSFLGRNLSSKLLWSFVIHPFLTWRTWRHWGSWREGLPYSGWKTCLSSNRTSKAQYLGVYTQGYVHSLRIKISIFLPDGICLAINTFQVGIQHPVPFANS